MSKPESLIHPWEDPAHFIGENYALHINESDSSFPPPVSFETEQARGTTLRFVFWGHTPENQEHVIPLLEGCDILALENIQDRVYADLTQRQEEQSVNKTTWDILSTLVTGSLPPEADQRIRRRGLNPDDYVDLSPAAREEQIRLFVSNTFADLLIHYSGRVEKVIELDIGLKDAPRWTKLDAESKQNEQTFLHALADGSGDWEQLRTHALGYLRTHTAADQFREGITVQQLEGLARENPGKTIGVLYGLRHQTLTRQIEAPGVGLQRLVAKNQMQVHPIPKALYTLEHHLESCLRSDVHDANHLDQYIAILLITLLVDIKEISLKRAIRIVEADDQLPTLAGQLRELWQKNTGPDGEESRERVNRRKYQTVALVRGAAVDPRLLGFMRRSH